MIFHSLVGAVLLRRALLSFLYCGVFNRSLGLFTVRIVPEEFARISHFPFPFLRKSNAHCNRFQPCSLHSAESKLGCFIHTVHTPAAVGEQMGVSVAANGTLCSRNQSLRTERVENRSRHHAPPCSTIGAPLCQ